MSVASAPEDLALFPNEKTVNKFEKTMPVVAQLEINMKRPSRKQKLSEKGKTFFKELKAKNRETAFQNLKRKLDHVRKLRENPDTELEVLEAERNELDILKDALNEACYAYESLLDTLTEKEDSYWWYDIRDREFTEQRMKLCEQIQGLERKSLCTKSSTSSKHGSSLQSKSSKGSKANSNSPSLRSVSQARAEAAAKAAKVKIEIEYLERENELKRIQLEKEYALAKAEESTFKEILDEESKLDKQAKQEIKTEDKETSFQNPITAPMQSVNNKVNPDSLPFVPLTIPDVHSQQPANNATNSGQYSDLKLTLSQLINLRAQQTQLSSMLINQQRTFHFPVKEPLTFSGDPFEYPAFVTAFESIIVSNVATERDKLFFLEKYTSGKANEAIKGFLATSSDTAYSKARKLLDQRFGNPVIVAEDYKRKLRGWRQISDGDSKGLQEFSDFLVRCEEAMKTMKSMSELDSTPILQSISTKLPSYSGVKWCRFAHDTQIKQRRLVAFKDFAQFVKEEAELANDPIFSPDVLKKERKKNGLPKDNNRSTRPKHQGGFNPSQSLATSATPVRKSKRQQPAATPQGRSCPVCNGSHTMEKCNTFIKATVDERLNIIREKRLCFGCFKRGHVFSECMSKSTCDECGKNHNTFLHRAIQKSESCSQQSPSSIESARNTTQQTRSTHAAESALSNAASVTHSSVIASTTTTTCRILPVILHHKDDPKKEI